MDNREKNHYMLEKYGFSLRKGMHYKEKFPIRKNETPIKKGFFNDFLEIIQGYILSFD